MSKLDQIKALGAAKREARKNTPEARGTARKAPTGKVVSVPAPMAEPSRNSVHASSNRKPGRPKIAGPRPWEAEGVSRATYYRDRRRSEGKAK